MVLEMEMSKTYQYRKVMKPMLERKRRARINKCLDELKDIMVECLTQEGEHITRLEKADILELTVEHMKKLRAQKQLRLGASAAVAGQDAKLTIAESFRAGYVHAANEVSKTLAAVPGVSVDLGTQLMSHLGHRLNYLQVVVPSIPMGLTVTTTTPAGNHLSPAATTTTTTTGVQLQQPTVISNATTTVSCNTKSVIQTHLPPSQYFATTTTNGQRSPAVITPPPSECDSIDSGSCSPTPSETAAMWRPW